MLNFFRSEHCTPQFYCLKLYCQMELLEIDDLDSRTNFSLSRMPFQKACGYSFCPQSEASTKSDDDYESFNSNSDVDNAAQLQDPDPKESTIASQLSAQLALVRKLYEEHKIDQAFNEMRLFRKLCEAHNQSIDQELEKYLSIIEEEMVDVSVYEKIFYQDGWVFRKEKKNLKISSRIEGNTVGVLVQAFLDLRPEKFLQVLLEMDLMKKFMPFMQISTLEKIVSRNCRIAHSVNNFPFITRRESFFQGVGYDRLDHNGTIFMFTRSIHNRPDLQQRLDYQVVQSKNAIQLDYKYFVIEYKALTPTTGTIKMAINTDLHLKLPMFILEAASEGFGEDFYKNIKKIANNFQGSEWQKRMELNPEFYNFIKERLNDYFNSKQVMAEE